MQWAPTAPNAGYDSDKSNVGRLSHHRRDPDLNCEQPDDSSSVTAEFESTGAMPTPHVNRADGCSRVGRSGGLKKVRSINVRGSASKIHSGIQAPQSGNETAQSRSSENFAYGANTRRSVAVSFLRPMLQKRLSGRTIKTPTKPRPSIARRLTGVFFLWVITPPDPRKRPRTSRKRVSDWYNSIPSSKMVLKYRDWCVQSVRCRWHIPIPGAP